jgi:hypothetical protein
MEHLYLARDSRGALTLFTQEPRKKEYVYNKGTSYEMRISGWTSDDYEKCGIGTMTISSKLYPEVTYENSPKKVTLKIE